MRDLSPTQKAVRGLVGTLTLVLLVLLSLNFNRLPVVGNSDVIEVQFAEAGGLKGGDSVMVSGAQVGKVRDVHLRGDRVIADVALTQPVQLGNLTRARIVTVTLLGRAGIELVPEGTGRLGKGDTIPRERTTSPYSITSALNQLASTTTRIDKAQLAEALQQTSATLSGTSDDIGPALRGISRLTEAVAANDDELRSLLARASRVSNVLASRNQQIATMLTSGRSLLRELDARQQVVVSLLDSAQSLSTQLKAVVAENRTTIAPALDQLSAVVKVLNRNRKALQDTITGVRGYATAFGEAISSGPWFDAYIQNLTSPSTLAPILSGVQR